MRTLCRELQRQGFTALIVSYSDCGDTDLRLVVSGPGTPVVELLGEYNTVPGDRWTAVRIDGADRSVWMGPPWRSPCEPVIDFVKAVLMEPPERLTERYRPQ